MEGIICSKEFIDFFHTIPWDTYEIKKIIMGMEGALAPLAKKLHIGRIDGELSAPVTFLESEGSKTEVMLYLSEDEPENVPYTFEFSAGENGKAKMKMYPVRGYHWSFEEEKEVRFLAHVLYIIGGRARMINLVKQMANMDTMTGVANTNGVLRFGKMLAIRGTLDQYVGIFQNLKNFKYINERVGSRNGDGILEHYCREIQRFLQSDELLGRLGGDNFMIMVKKDRAEEYLKHISNIKIPLLEADGMVEVPIESRAGLYAVQLGDSMGEIMNGSSIALKQAREGSQADYVWFEAEMLKKDISKKKISSLFPSALEQKEFVVYYQPKIHLKTKQLYGGEALVRWFRKGKMIPPMEFIPVLEEEGTICKLDFYVLEEVCSQLKKWQNEGADLVRISSNFSKLHLKNNRLAEDIYEVVQKYGIDTKYIEIELTELSGYQDSHVLEVFLEKMKKYGISVSLDDFGTGYSSLNMLKDLEFDILKIDKSFLDALQENSRTGEILVKNIVNIGNGLGIEVIAEGVETSEQAQMLKELNCQMAQGYLYDRPLPKEEFEQRLKEENPY